MTTYTSLSATGVPAASPDPSQLNLWRSGSRGGRESALFAHLRPREQASLREPSVAVESAREESPSNTVNLEKASKPPSVFMQKLRNFWQANAGMLLCGALTGALLGASLGAMVGLMSSAGALSLPGVIVGAVCLAPIGALAFYLVDRVCGGPSRSAY